MRVEGRNDQLGTDLPTTRFWRSESDVRALQGKRKSIERDAADVYMYSRFIYIYIGGGGRRRAERGCNIYTHVCFIECWRDLEFILLLVVVVSPPNRSWRVTVASKKKKERRKESRAAASTIE